MSIISQRFLSLDVFRGLTICFMIIVNTPGNYETTFPALTHADWHGFTATDLVFPSFMFAVGNAMSFVMLKWDALPAGQVVGKILKRTFIIFLLGYLMYWFPFFKLENGQITSFPITETRIFGVLQRIALAYGIVSLMLYFLKPSTTVVITILLLLFYWPVMMHFGDASNPLSKHGNAVLKLDTWLVGSNHLYSGEGFPFDPEGLLSTIPSLGNVVAGYVVGRFIQLHGKSYEGLTKLLLAGFVLVAIAHFWSFAFPINKKLWTSSFVLHTVGLDCMILSGIIYLVDIQGKTKWTNFFQVFGKNPLFIYLLSELVIITFFLIHPQQGVNLYSWLFLYVFSWLTPYLGSLAQAIFYMLICWAVGYWLDKKKIYVRV